MILQENLLGMMVDVTLSGANARGRIQAMYLKNGSLYMLVVDEAGKFHYDLLPSQLAQIKVLYKVRIGFPHDRKIHAIKCVRELTSISLREAKDLCEGDCIVKQFLTYEAAINLVKTIQQHELTATISPMEP